METLVFVAEHRNQHCSRAKPQGPARLGSSPSRHFREINCRAFHSGTGILPIPFKDSSTPVKKCFSPASPSKTPSPTIKYQSNPNSVDNTPHKTTSKSSPIPINVKVPQKVTPFIGEMGLSNENLPFSELWAGPTYSCSPPPSSLPIPKFSMRPKRTTSLELPVSNSGVRLQPVAKSAPASPTRVHSPSPGDLLLRIDSATITLRRILNLDVADE